MQRSSRQSEWCLQKFIKWCNSHAQLTTWCCRCNESKHHEVAFQLAAADFGSNSLWQTSYLKDNSWMSTLGYCCIERIWNNYIEIHQKSILVMLIMVWSTQGYNSLDDPTRQLEVWRKILLQADPIEGLKVYRKKFLPTKSAALCLFLQYTI